MPVLNKVTITVNGNPCKILQGTNSFQNIVATAAYEGAYTGAAHSIAVNTAAASQNSTIGANQSYVISGGEVFTIS